MSSQLQKINNNQIVWILGPTASGKTTLAKRLLIKFRQGNKIAVHYDGDEARKLFGPNLGFEAKDRLQVIKALVYIANKALDAGVDVIVSALTAHEDARNYVRKNIKNLVLVYLNCSIKKCIERDPKGLYKKAIDEEINTLIGFNSEYTPVENPNIIIDTECLTIDECVDQLLIDLKRLESL